VATDANGTYRHQVISLIDGADLCVRVTAAPANNASVTATAQGQGVRLKRLAPASLPYDSIRVDVRLP
jgi:hypothetical protein